MIYVPLSHLKMKATASAYVTCWVKTRRFRKTYISYKNA